MRAMLRRAPALASAVLTVEDLTIDTRVRRVERAGRPIQLATKEYTLLEYLARRRGDTIGPANIGDRFNKQLIVDPSRRAPATLRVASRTWRVVQGAALENAAILGPQLFAQAVEFLSDLRNVAVRSTDQ
jgi:hypothetical protein